MNKIMNKIMNFFCYSGNDIKGTVEWDGYTADYFIGQAYEYGKMDALNDFKKAVQSRDCKEIEKTINRQMRELDDSNRDELGTKLLNLFIKLLKE